MANKVSAPQADGNSIDPNARAENDPDENVADEVIVDGRESGLDPDYDDDSPSAVEAGIQDRNKK